MRLKPDLTKGITAIGFKEPSEIQVEAIPLIMQGEDVVIQAKTGTGKTAAYGIPLLELIDARHHSIKALIIVPTRELAQQAEIEINLIGKFTRIKVVPVYGGQSINVQLNLLNKHPQIVAGTPGRLLDLMRQGKLNFKELEFLILDEADKMLEMGFIEDVEVIIKQLPRQRQTMLFSATMKPEIKEIARKYMRSVAEINHSEDKLTVEGIDQYYVQIDNPRQKIAILTHVLDKMKITKGLIFCTTKRYCDVLQRELKRRNISAVAMHGNMTQAMRERSLEHFKHDKTRILVATNLAARGLHIEDVSHVINYDCPLDMESYVHRIGRTGRQGKSGTAITFIGGHSDRRQIMQIAADANTDIKPLRI